MAQASRFTQREIKELFAVGRRTIRRPTLDIILAPASSGIGRLLVITPRHVGNAPQRNTIRRRLKALFYRESLASHGYDCGVIVKIGGIHLSPQELKDLLLLAFQRIRDVPHNRHTIP